jgi:hypothetical protein
MDCCLHWKVKETSCFDEVTVVPQDFFFEIPRQNVIRVRRSDLILQYNGNVHAGRHQTLAKRIFFD